VPDFDGYFAEKAARPERRDLTATEVEILRWASHGLTDQMTAEAMGRSLDTVKNSGRAARAKLAAKNTAHAVAIALRLGLID
jgi:DNA-binding CsgD family transcriptional regulator